MSASQVTGVNLSSVGVSDTMSIWNKRVQLTVGVRRQTAGSEVNNLFATAAAPNRPFQAETLWTPAYALVVKPVENISLYANYIEGLQTPHVVGGSFFNVGTVFPPSKTTQAETGVKIDMGRLTTTLSVFEIEQPSVIAVGTGATATLELNGRQRNRGAELNVFGEITPAIRVLGGLALIDGVKVNTPTVRPTEGRRSAFPPSAPTSVRSGIRHSCAT